MVVVAYCALAGFIIYDSSSRGITREVFQEITTVGGFSITYAWLLLLPPINFLLVYAGARYILYCILYPYQNSIQREGLDRSNNERFGKEFCFYLECFLYTFQVHCGISQATVETEITEKDDKSSGKSSKGAQSSMSIKSKQLINFGEMKNLFDLLVSFAEANRHVINEKKSNSSRLFAQFTDLLEEILETLDQVEVHAENSVRVELKQIQ